MKLLSSPPSTGLNHKTDSSSGLQYTTWGIFKIAYVPSTKFPAGMLWNFIPTISALHRYRSSLNVLRRLMSDMWHMSKWHCMKYFIYEMATVTSPAVGLFAAYHVQLNLHAIAAGISTDDTSMRFTNAQIWVIFWFIWGNLSQLRCDPLLRFRGHIGGHMRYRYMPELIKAQLHAPEDGFKLRMLVGIESFGEYIPGWSSFEQLATHICRSLEITFQVLAIGYIARKLELAQGTLLVTAVVLSIFSFVYLPTNIVGGAGYTFWTENEVYHSLMRIHTIIFNDRHRPTAIRDGITDNICQEYEKKLKTLGPVKADTWILSMGLTPHWYWTILAGFVRNSPMAIYALGHLIFTPDFRPSSLISCMSLVQYVVYSMNSSLQAAKGMGQIKSCEEVAQICEDLRSFYDFLDSGSMLSLTERNGVTKGASLMLSNVTTSSIDAAINPKPYSRRMSAALAFNIAITGGEVVGVVIDNQQERLVLGEIVSGLLPIQSGSITWDSRSLSSGDIAWPRREMAYATSEDTIYPLSLKDNVLMGLDSSQKRLVGNHDLEMAAHLCELSPVVDMYGWDYIPDGTTIIGNSVMPQPDLEAWKALDKHYPPPGISNLTESQRFSIVLCRTYIRVKHGNARFIFLEKPGNGADTCPAFESLCELARDDGKTLMIVASEANMPALNDDRVKLDRIIRL